MNRERGGEKKRNKEKVPERVESGNFRPYDWSNKTQFPISERGGLATDGPYLSFLHFDAIFSDSRPGPEDSPVLKEGRGTIVAKLHNADGRGERAMSCNIDDDEEEKGKDDDQWSLQSPPGVGSLFLSFSISSLSRVHPDFAAEFVVRFPRSTFTYAAGGSALLYTYTFVAEHRVHPLLF